ncbi:hypothetical protein GGS20DRAFT_532296 [Poronia punctata]|nr:hypothetical protein GGS20DRAFT_532296 [Poronia punctata]
MPLPSIISQASLAAAIGLSAAGLWAGTQPPNPSPDKIPATGDTIRFLINALHKYGNLVYVPVGLVVAPHMILALTYPNFPDWLARYITPGCLDSAFFTWSKTTAVPLALVLGIGTPLRLISYGTLGKNFTFALSEPDRLNTTGLYRYIQHPSYTGALALGVGAVSLWGRFGSSPSCFFPWWLFSRLQPYEKGIISLLLAGALSVIWHRVKDEEALLHAKFGSEWESWHSRTARFIPFLF